MNDDEAEKAHYSLFSCLNFLVTVVICYMKQ